MNFGRSFGCALVLSAFVAACSSDNSSTGSDGGTGAADSGSGGKSSGGSSSGGKGGASTGGMSTSGGSGGKATGGSSSGGASSGGSAGKDAGSTMPDAATPDGAAPDGGIPKRPMLGAQIDRMGRPAINTALNHTFDTVAATKDAAKNAYNAALPATWPTFEGEFEKNLAILDSLDGTCGNQLLAATALTATRYKTLADVLTDDQLYVNTTQSTCGVYLGVEAEAVNIVGSGSGKCGGRTPKDDVIERSYSVLAAGALSGVDDTITADDGAQTTTFPFLGPPTP